MDRLYPVLFEIHILVYFPFREPMVINTRLTQSFLGSGSAASAFGGQHDLSRIRCMFSSNRIGLSHRRLAIVYLLDRNHKRLHLIIATKNFFRIWDCTLSSCTLDSGHNLLLFNRTSMIPVYLIDFNTPHSLSDDGLLKFT